jgi:capsular exopolysaccharide synthesis family protein
MTPNSSGSDFYPAGQGAYPEASAGGLSLVQVAHVLKTRWWLVLLGVGIATAAAWFLIPPDRSYFQAATIVRFEDARAEVSAGLAGPQADTRSQEFMLSQIHVIRSNSLVGEVVDNESLRFWPSEDLPLALFSDVAVESGPEAADSLRFRFARDSYTVQSSAGREISARFGELVEMGGVRFTLRGPPAEVSEAMVYILPRQTAISVVTAGINVVPRNRTVILDISYQNPDPTRAVRVVNAVSDAYREFNAFGAQQSARIRREFLQEQLLEAEGALARNQAILREFQEADRSFGSRERLESERSNLLALDVQRRTLEEERRTYQSFLDRINRAADDQLDLELRTLMAAPGVATGPLLSQLYTELTGYQLERERLLASGQAMTNPAVQQLTSLIDARRASIEDAARTQVSSLDLQIAAIDDQRMRSAAALRALPEAGAEEVRLLEEVETARATLAALRTEYQRARLAESLDVSQVQIVDYATFAAPVTVGTRQRTLVFALIFGFLLGGGSALLLEVTNTSVRGRTELETLLAVPGLGTIPRISAAGKNGRPTRAIPAKASPVNGAGGKPHVPAVAARNGASSAPARAELQDFHSMAAEAYRMLRTNLVFLSPEGQIRTLVVTSAASGDGKTTTAANLAVAFARQGKRVLLVDCDLRRPRLHTLFGVPRSPGFTDLLLGKVSGNQAIRPTRIERLSILPRGDFDEQAAEMLSGSIGRNLIERLRDHWDLVIFDTSPVLLTADATAVSPNIDGVLLVVRAGKTSREAARQAVQQLNVVGAQVLGFVLNDPDLVGEKYGEYKYVKEYYTVEV